MGEITSFKAKRTLEIENATRIDGEIDEDERLILERKDGKEVDVGSVAADYSKVDPIGLEPLIIPQICGLPVILYGHSLTAPAGWHTTGAHWSTRLAAHNSESLFLGLGIGGSTMESTSNLISGSTGSRWNPTPPTAKVLAIVMCVLNSATGIVVGSTLAQSVLSMKEAARSIIVTILSTGYSWADTVLSVTTNAVGASGWSALGIADGRPSVAYPSGSMTYATANAAWIQAVIPAGVSNRHVWVEVLSTGMNVAQPTARISKNGVVVSDTLLPYNDLATSSYHKHMLYVGVCSAGDTVRLTKIGAAGALYMCGVYISHDTNHAAMICDVERLITPMYPFFENEVAAAAHNQALKDVVAEMNALIPNGASISDMANDPTYPGPKSQWSGDTVHPNDLGQSWYHARISQKLTAALPWTPRLHVI